MAGAGRTDAGVHALGQVAGVRVQAKIPAAGFLRGLNANLPPDIAEQISKLAALRDQGHITDAEYEAKKAELLERM